MSTERTKKAQAFWDGSAEWNVHRAIYDSAEVRDEKTRERAFDDSGESDALGLVSYFHAGSRVLDLGCGIGRVMRPLAPFCREVIGIDISEKMIAKGREYMAGVPNARLVHTGGAELPTVADRSVDFLYSLICLIHVDKRTAFRYFREMARVLAPRGMVLLQFENLLSPEGLAEFQRVVDLDIEYPLEFYTHEEVRQLARAVGLKVLHFEESRQFLFATLCREDPETWIRTIREGVELAEPHAEGSFAGAARSGRTGARIVSRIPWPLPLRLHANIVHPDDPRASVFRLEGQVVVPASGSCRIEIEHDERGQGRCLLNGEVVPFQKSWRGPAPVGGRLHLRAGLTPGGFPNTPETARLFPNLYPG